LYLIPLAIVERLAVIVAGADAPIEHNINNKTTNEIVRSSSTDSMMYKRII
jgi:hypothetical protein